MLALWIRIVRNQHGLGLQVLGFLVLGQRVCLCGRSYSWRRRLWASLVRKREIQAQEKHVLRLYQRFQSFGRAKSDVARTDCDRRSQCRWDVDWGDVVFGAGDLSDCVCRRALCGCDQYDDGCVDSVDGQVSVLCWSWEGGLRVGVSALVELANIRLYPSILKSSEYEEWGNPNKTDFFDYMLSYSPYDNVKAGAKMPNILVKTGLWDPRVQYWEPRLVFETMLLCCV